jgi:hypothetical protein
MGAITHRAALPARSRLLHPLTQWLTPRVQLQKQHHLRLPLQHALDLKAMMRRGGGRGEGSRVRFCVVWAKGTISREVVAMEVVLVAERGAARKRLRCWPGRGCGE